MNDFNALKRQKYLTEEYYENAKKFYIKNIKLEAVRIYKDDKHTSGEAGKWESIALDETSLLFLEYTAGIVDISKLNENLERIIQAYYKRAYAIGEFHNMEFVEVLNPDKTILFYSLALLLDNKKLISDVIKLTTKGEKNAINQDEFLNLLFQWFDSDYPVLGKGTFFASSYIYIDVWISVVEKNDKNHAIELLHEKLGSWYKSQKYEFWYNSHLDMENRTSYVGYWCFEAAMLVYLLDLDDSSLHKYVYYPKDIVTWIRSVKPIKAVFESE